MRKIFPLMVLLGLAACGSKTTVSNDPVKNASFPPPKMIVHGHRGQRLPSPLGTHQTVAEVAPAAWSRTHTGSQPRQGIRTLGRGRASGARRRIEWAAGGFAYRLA